MIYESVQSIGLEFGPSGQSILKRLVRTIFTHGGPTDEVQTKVNNLPGDLATAVQELLGSALDEAAYYVDPANPKQRFANRKEMLAAIFRRKLSAGLFSN